jgi:hypothetical protein
MKSSAICTIRGQMQIAERVVSSTWCEPLSRDSFVLSPNMAKLNFSCHHLFRHRFRYRESPLSI